MLSSANKFLVKLGWKNKIKAEEGGGGVVEPVQELITSELLSL